MAIRLRVEVVDEPEHLLPLALQLPVVERAVPRGAASTASTCSCFGGSSAATASFVRRSMSGRIRRRSAASRSASPPRSIGRPQLLA